MTNIITGNTKIIGSNTLRKWEISDLPELKIHLNGDDSTRYDFRDGNIVEKWKGASGTLIDAVQTNEALQPVYNSNLINGRGGVTFSNFKGLTFGTGKFGSGNSPYTFIVIGRIRGINTYFFRSIKGLVDKDSIGLRRTSGTALVTVWYNSNLIAGNWTEADYNAFITMYDQTGRSHFINNINVGSDSVTGKVTDITGECVLGLGALTDMDILEFIYCESALNEQNRLNVHNYIINKY